MGSIRTAFLQNVVTSICDAYKLKLCQRVNFLYNMSSNVICYLKSVKDPEKRINLLNNAPFILGRNIETGVKDISMSRAQLECTADLTSKTVVVKTIGRSFAGCNGLALVKNETYRFKQGDVIELRLGHHLFEIVFEDTQPPTKKQKIADFFNFKPQSSNLSMDGKWEEIDRKELLVYTPENCKAQEKIAAFDIDGTIIKTKSGARFPKDPTDWVFNYSDLPKKLQKLGESHKIAFFTNQSGIGKDSGKIKGFKGKIESIIQKIGIPVQVFVATGRSIYRKPAPGMWNVLLSKNPGVDVTIPDSFYVGDAAGRDKNWAPNMKKDHSNADRLFALNLGLKFFTPEEHFQGAKPAKFLMPEFDPRDLPIETYPSIERDEQEVVIMVGGPGSGKSFFSRNRLVSKGYIQVSRDKVGSWQKCVKLLEEYLGKGKSVVIDNTNGEKEKRQRFIEVAKRLKVGCRCFVMATTYKHAKHNNRFREITDKTHEAVGDIILHGYKKSYQEPELSEGFDEIIKIPFVAKFDKNEHEKLYKMFLVED